MKSKDLLKRMVYAKLNKLQLAKLLPINEGDTIISPNKHLVVMDRDAMLTEDNIAHLREAMASANRIESTTGSMKIEKCEYCDGLINKLKKLARRGD